MGFTKQTPWWCLAGIATAGMLLILVEVHAAGPWRPFKAKHANKEIADGAYIAGDLGGDWYWHRSPEQEARVMAARYNRYCIRCHGVDGRGVWDVPDVPDLTNGRWQATRTDAQFARAILEGRGAVMPAFRGTLALEESWAMARYLRSFVPGSEASKPDLGEETKNGDKRPIPAPAKADTPMLPNPPAQNPIVP